MPLLTANPDQEDQCPAQRVHDIAEAVLGSGGDRGWSHVLVTLALATVTMGLLTLLADCFPGTRPGVSRQRQHTT